MHEIDENILRAAVRFQKILPVLQSKDGFFAGEWSPVEELNVLLRKASGDFLSKQIGRYLDDLPIDPNLDEGRKLIQAAHEALNTQDRLSGIDARQIVGGNRSRTWSIRSWSIAPNAARLFAIRKGYFKDDKYSEECEYRRRREALESDFEAPGWFLQLCLDNTLEGERVLAAGYCRLRCLISALADNSKKAQVVDSGHHQYYLIPVAEVEGHRIISL